MIILKELLSKVQPEMTGSPSKRSKFVTYYLSNNKIRSENVYAMSRAMKITKNGSEKGRRFKKQGAAAPQRSKTLNRCHGRRRHRSQTGESGAPGRNSAGSTGHRWTCFEARGLSAVSVSLISYQQDSSN